MATKIKKKPWATLKVYLEDKHTLQDDKNISWHGRYKYRVKNGQLQGEITVANKTVIVNGEKHSGKSNFLHEITHFIMDVISGRCSRHTKKFYRIWKFLNKELAK